MSDTPYDFIDLPPRNLGTYLNEIGKRINVNEAQDERDRMAWELYKSSLSFGVRVDAVYHAQIAYEKADAFLAERDKQRGGK